MMSPGGGGGWGGVGGGRENKGERIYNYIRVSANGRGRIMEKFCPIISKCVY